MSNIKLKKTVSIIIPIYNEEKTIIQILEKIQSVKFPGYKKEIIIVDDESSDNSFKLIKQLKKSHKNLTLLTQPHAGRGKALQTGIKKAAGQIIIFQDADLEYDPSDLPKLVREFKNPKTQVVYGSRTIDPTRKGYPLYVTGVWFLTALVNKLTGKHLTDLYTGYKLFRTPIVKSLTLKSNGFEFEPEITIKLIKKKIIIKELPIHYYPRTFAQGKKVTPLDGFKGFFTILKYYYGIF